MKNTSMLLLAFTLTGLAPVYTPLATEAAVLQSFDQLFIDDDASESFEFSLPQDPAVPTTLRFAGFVENRHTNAEGAVRFFLGWQTNSAVASDGATRGSIIFPPWPDYLHGVRLPAADAASGPIRVPIEFQAEIDFSPGWVKLAVEGLTGDDNFRFVGDFTMQPEPRLRFSRVDTTTAQIAWRTNSVGYHLEYATTFPASVWTIVTNAVSVVGGDFSVRVETADAQRVYRLRKP